MIGRLTHIGVIGIVLMGGMSANAQALFSKKKTADQPVAARAGSTDVVAKVNGEGITREELCAELIEMYGKEHLESMIGRKLVQQQCRTSGIEVTEVDVRKELDNILQRNNLQLKEFRERVLASQNMTLGQYLRDQVWPRLALVRLVESRVAVNDEDLGKAFEANFGEKVDIRMLTVVERRKAEEIWKQVHDQASTEEKVKLFEDLARRFSTDEATRPYGGKAAPIGRHSIAEELELAAFALQPGDLGSIMQVPGGHLILLCVGRVPARTDVTLDTTVEQKKAAAEGEAPAEAMTYRDLLRQDIERKKILQEVGVYYKKLEEDAKIENFLTGEFEADSLASPVTPNSVDPTAPLGAGAGN